MGCPMLTAPPSTLTLLGSRPSLRVFAMATTLKASLISHNAMSSTPTPARFSTFGMASAGATGKSTGLVAASANAVTSPTTSVHELPGKYLGGGLRLGPFSRYFLQLTIFLPEHQNLVTH